MKLLKETTGIDTLSKWKYIKSDIETDPRFKAETSECRKKQWFKEYIKKLKQVSSVN